MKNITLLASATKAQTRNLCAHRVIISFDNDMHLPFCVQLELTKDGSVYNPRYYATLEDVFPAFARRCAAYRLAYEMPIWAKVHCEPIRPICHNTFADLLS